MELLIFFALPLATIILSIILQKILKNPILVALTFFAIYLIVAFSLFALGTITDLGVALVAVIVYTIIAFLTAFLTKLFKEILRRLFPKRPINHHNCRGNNSNSDDNDLLTISCNCNNGNSRDLLTVSSNCLLNSDNQNNGCCRNNNDVSLANNTELLAGTTNNPSSAFFSDIGTEQDFNTVNNNAIIDNQNQCTQNANFDLRGNVIPNNRNGGRTGWVRGAYRRF